MRLAKRIGSPTRAEPTATGTVRVLAPEAGAHMTHGLGLARPDHCDFDQRQDVPKPAQSRARFRPEVDQVTCQKMTSKRGSIARQPDSVRAGWCGLVRGAERGCRRIVIPVASSHSLRSTRESASAPTARTRIGGQLSLGAADDDRAAAHVLLRLYLAAKSRIRVIDVSKIDGNVRKLMDDCADTPNITVPQAFRQALGRP